MTVRIAIGDVCARAHDLQQRHHVRRGEEVQCRSRPPGAASRAAICVDIQCRSIGREHGARLHDLSSWAKIFRFRSMFSNTASMIDVGIGEIVVVERAADQLHAVAPCLPAIAAAIDHRFVRRVDVCQSAIERFGLASSIVTGMPAFAKQMAIPPPIVPAPIDAGRDYRRCSMLVAAARAFVRVSRSAKNACTAPMTRGSLAFVDAARFVFQPCCESAVAPMQQTASTATRPADRFGYSCARFVRHSFRKLLACASRGSTGAHRCGEPLPRCDKRTRTYVTAVDQVTFDDCVDETQRDALAKHRPAGADR